MTTVERTAISVISLSLGLGIKFNPIKKGGVAGL